MTDVFKNNIINIDNLKISNDILNFKLYDWILYYKTTKCINKPQITNILNSNNIENINKNYINTYDKYENITVLNALDIYLGSLNHNWSTYCIKYRDEIVGICKVNNYFDTIYIENLITSPFHNNYEIIHNIINNINIKYNSLCITIDELLTNSTEQNLDDIMKYYNFVKYNIQNKYSKNDLVNYIYINNQYNYIFTDKFKLEIIIYDDYNKTNILAKHLTNFKIKTEQLESQFVLYDIIIGRNKIKPKIHNLFSYKICLEEPLIYKVNLHTPDVYMDISVNINGNIYKIECQSPSDLRLNKLSIDRVNLNLNDDIINIVKSFSCFKNICSCDYCRAHLQKYTQLYISSDPRLISYYYGFVSNYNIYDFFDKLLAICKKLLIKFDTEISKINYLPITNFNFKEFDLQLLFEENIIDNNSQDIFNYVYLLQKFDINENKFIYKFGKTSRDFQKRIKEHGREAKLLLILDVDNCSFCESQVLNSLKSDPNIKHCKNIGNEYFSCDNKRYIVQKITKILS